ncbi:calcium-binding protein [Acidovorax sp. FJL06]|nr:calcium-binding protein [Acidovorax sp. FJL06]
MGALWAPLGGAALAQAPAAATPAEPVAKAATESEAALTPGEIKARREFKLLDSNGDGKLSRSEVKLFPRLSAAFDEADTDGDGFVSYEEVRAFAAKVRAQRDRQRAAQAAAQAATTTTTTTPTAPAAPETRP